MAKNAEKQKSSTITEMEDKVRETIHEKYLETLKSELSGDFRKVLDEWMDTEILRLLANTVSIPNIEVRSHSVVILFGKKFDKVRLLIRIMEKHGLNENTDAFAELLYLL
ncbi:MAG: hypothetical protein HPY53_15065 [Brevinematales bacterium]|nr:hypothetical protein [Brevinematales bacterium]